MSVFPLAELKRLPSLSRGQTADLKVDYGRTRVWLERVGTADGAPYDNQVVVETFDGHRWRVTHSSEAT